MILSLMSTLLQLLLIPQVLLWVLVSEVLSFFYQNFSEPEFDFLFSVLDWIECCISKPVIIVIDSWKEITYVVLEFATRPLRFALVLSAHFVDWFWGLFVRTSNFCWFIFFVTPFKKPLQHLAEVVPSGVGKVLPEEVVQEAQGFKDLILVEFGRIASLGAFEQLPELGNWTKSVGDLEKKFATMMSVVGGQAVANKLSNVTGKDPGPDERRLDWTTDYTASVVYGLSHVFLQYISQEEGSKEVTKLLEFTTTIGQELAVTEDAQKASAAQGHSAILGTYDAAGSKMQDITSKVPGPLKGCIMPVLVCYACLFCSGLLFSLIRFSLYGLH